MWVYEKKLEFPVSIKKADLRVVKILMAQIGGPDSELSAALTYLSQRYSMPDDRVRATLTDIGTEELAHWEMLCAMVHQMMNCASISAIKAAGLDTVYVQHGPGIFPADANGVPWTSAYIGVTGDPIADITNDMAASRKPAPPTNTSCSSPTTRTSRPPSASCANGKSSTSRDLESASIFYRTWSRPNNSRPTGKARPPGARFLRIDKASAHFTVVRILLFRLNQEETWARTSVYLQTQITSHIIKANIPGEASCPPIQRREGR